VFTIPLPILDGTDDTKHVRCDTRCVYVFLANGVMLMPPKVNFATYLLLDREYTMRKPSEMSIIGAISLLTFTAVVFRAEVALLLGPFCLHLLITRRTTLSKLIRVGLVSGLASLGEFFVVDRELAVF
jgi:alpha-1,6-mannosyltransferase